MIEYEKRAMIEAEDKYTFRQSTQISMQTGLIGHLRADMDTDGNGFFSSWFDFREELKTDEFKAEFDEVINSLREDGDILHNRRALAKYCYCTPQSRMQEEPGYYGVRVDTEKYAYLLRLNPDRGEYNLYCYCYRRDWLDQHRYKEASMSEPYNHKAIEKKVAGILEEHETFKTDVWDFSKPKYYALDMFPTLQE